MTDLKTRLFDLAEKTGRDLRRLFALTDELGASSGVSSVNARKGDVVLVAGDIPAIAESQVVNLIADLASKQAGSANLTTFAGIAPSANIQSLLGSANFAAVRVALGLTVGTDVQAYNAILAALAGLTLSQGDILYRDASGLTRLPAGTSGQFLKTLGAAANPAWGTVPFPFGFSPPLANDFTLFSGDGTAASKADDADVGLVITTGAAANTAVLRGCYKALPAVGNDFSVIARCVLNTLIPTSFTWGGLTMYESATGKSHNLFLTADISSDTGFHLRRQNISGTFDSEVVVGYYYTLAGWFKMERTGTTLKFSTSNDGKNWHVVQSIAQTTYLTTAPDRIGLSMLLSHATVIPILSVPYWLQTGF